MPTTSGLPEPHCVLQPSSTTTPPSVLSPIVPVQQPLSPQEIERICKAFIRLITAKEENPHGTASRPRKIRQRTAADSPASRKGSNLHQSSSITGTADTTSTNI